MGTVNVVFSQVGGPENRHPAFNAGVIAAENITSGASAANSASATTDCFVRIATDTSVYVKVGPSAVAASGDQWLLFANQALDLSVKRGDRVSVIDA